MAAMEILYMLSGFGGEDFIEMYCYFNMPTINKTYLILSYQNRMTGERNMLSPLSL
jgi:hypothetical protein